MNRRGPADGYEFGAKRHYRRIIWKLFRGYCGVDRGAVHALLMPSLMPSNTGGEIEVALQNGFKECHLHVVDRNAAIVAHIKRRFPRIHTYGVELDRAVDRMADKGVRIAVANFDLCGHIGTTKRLMRQVAEANILTSNAMVAITMLRGRENKGLLPLLIAALDGPIDVSRMPLFPVHTKTSDVARVVWAAGQFIHGGHEARVVRVGIYPSGAQTMLWSAYTLTQNHALKQQFEEKLAELQASA